MSVFTDYSPISENYDKSRIAAGADLYLQKMKEHFGEDFSNIHVLDAGCGTGNYSLALCRAGVENLSLFDASRGMLKRAELKLHQFDQRIILNVKEGQLPILPFDNESMDVIMINQVLHHLDTDTECHSKVYAALREAYRVLRPGGLFLLSSSTPQQSANAYWYFYLIPHRVPGYIKKFEWTNRLDTFLPSIGFRAETLTKMSISSPKLSTTIECPEGPLSKDWRDQDSFFSFATEEEIDDMLVLLRNRKENGSLQQLYEDLKMNCKDVGLGHSTLIMVSK